MQLFRNNLNFTLRGKIKKDIFSNDYPTTKKKTKPKIPADNSGLSLTNCGFYVSNYTNYDTLHQQTHTNVAPSL